MSTLTMRAAAQARGVKSWFRHGTRVLLYRAVLKALALSRLNRWISFWMRHYIAVEPERLRVPARAPRGMRVEELTPEAVDGLEALRPGAAQDFRQRLADGHRCYAARLEGRCVAFLWAVAGPREVQAAFRARWQIPAGMLWLYDLYSNPGVLGAMPYLNAMIANEMVANAMRANEMVAQPLSGSPPLWLAGQVDYDNHRSRQAHRSLGYRVVAGLWTVGVGCGRVHVLLRRPLHRCRLLFGNARVDLAALHRG